jgi:sugar/nucleoside kinase (ribokinase family)
MQLAQRHNVDMPIVTGVNAVVNGLITPAEMALALMTRDKTSEVNATEMTVRFESALQRRRMHGQTRRILVGGTFPVLTHETIAWLKNAKAQGTWLAVALVNDGDEKKLAERTAMLSALRCVDRVIPVAAWADLEEAKEQLLWGLAQADVVKISDEEVEFLFDLTPEAGADYILEHYGVKLVFVTCGARGCFFANKEAKGFVPALKDIRVADTTGAGDIFGGSAVWKLLQLGKAPETLTEQELKEITAFACVSAGLSTTKAGGISSVPQYEAVLREMERL